MSKNIRKDMCGVLGFVTRSSLNESSEKQLKKMASLLAHRGPNDEGIWFERSPEGITTGLGHRRLSILDLSANGHQPMEWGEFVISYNGEIYNYLELRAELERLGFEFKTQTDTEVILVAYKVWGFEAFKKFNGMWALCIYDRKLKQIILSRDRFGKKPLYYHLSKNHLIFASEPKALLAYKGFQFTPNYKKIFRYLAGNYRYVDTDHFSFFNEILQVPSATVCYFSQDFKMTSKRYWTLFDTRADLSEISDHEAIERFRNLFFNSVEIRLRSDVPVGCFLSGGLDSTSITCVATKILGKQIQTFSGVTGEGVFDESEYIDSVVEATGAQHQYIRPKPTDIFETVREMLHFHDEPVCTVTWYSIYLIAKQIAKLDIRVVLNGHGGDETCGGYWDYYQYNFWDLEQAHSASLDFEVTEWHRNHSRHLSEIENHKLYMKDLFSEKKQQHSRFPDYSSAFKIKFRDQYANTLNLSAPYSSWLSKRMYSDLIFETVPPVLRAEDRNTMANSIESRSPFLDYRLTEFTFSLPNQFKIRNGLGKWLIRESMKGILPENVRTRSDKTGFIAPFDHWIRTSNRHDFEVLLEQLKANDRGVYDVPVLNSLFAEHLNGNRNHSMFFWQLLNLELWFQRFFDDMSLK